MANQNTVWVVLASDEVVDKLRSLIDKGYLGDAQALHYQLSSMMDKLNKTLSARGGSVRLFTYDRMVLEMSSATAEDLPEIISPYKDFFGNKLAVGIGFDLSEASGAALKSARTNEIELYDPSDDTYKSEEAFQLPPNLFDRTDPEPPEPEKRPKRKPLKQPMLSNAQTALQAETAMMQSIIQQLTPQPPQPAAPPSSPQQPAGQQQPRDLMEMLHGQRIEGHQADEQKKESKPEPEKQEISDNGHEKIAGLLATVQDKMPKLMELSDKNPEAFKKIVSLIHKIVDVAKLKNTKKSEIITLTEELNKAFRHRWPIGTVKGRRKKVLVNGREVWRQMSAGQVLDPNGEPVSVKSINSKAKAGQ